MSNEAKDHFFLAGVSFGIVGLIFFSISLYAVSHAHNKKYEFFAEHLNKQSENISTKIDNINQGINILSSSGQEEQNSESNHREHLIALNYDFINLIYEIKQQLNSFNHQFIIVSLLGGSFLEIIALMNFHQYGKIASPNSERINKKQLLELAQKFCNITEDLSARQECIKGILVLGDEHYNGNNSRDSSETLSANGKKTSQ